ncbi:MAG: putative tellurite resistance protein B-like protein [Flavobacteriales bacterium]|jgi:uncharacterized tellurite resistance protein B-like protein
MSYTSLSHVMNLFSSTSSPEAKEELFKEVTLLTLARATRADLVTTGPEVEVVQALLVKLFDEEISSADIRVAASSELFEAAPLNRYLAATAAQLDLEQNQAILKALIDVFSADGKVTEPEIAFFNMVATSLGLTAAEIIGLSADS